jgi:hypothetical protein
LKRYSTTGSIELVGIAVGTVVGIGPLGVAVGVGVGTDVGIDDIVGDTVIVGAGVGTRVGEPSLYMVEIEDAPRAQS